MHDEHEAKHGPTLNLNLNGRFDIHVYLHFDHAALGAKLREATSDLKAAVESASSPVPDKTPSS